MGGTFLSRGAPACVSLTLDNQEDLTVPVETLEAPQGLSLLESQTQKRCEWGSPVSF